jgi:DNA-binding transcriptional LysR family regulator
LGETRSFRQTAERNGVTASAVSQSLRAMEKQFGARLAVRRRNDLPRALPHDDPAGG